MSKIRQFDSNNNNNNNTNSNDNNNNDNMKIHVAKVQIMPSITLTNPELKSVSITDTTSVVNGESNGINWKDYYGDDEKGKLKKINSFDDKFSK